MYRTLCLLTVLAAGAALVVGALAVPAVASARPADPGNVVYTCGAPGGPPPPCPGVPPSTTTPTTPVTTVTNTSGSSILPHFQGIPITFAVSCCPPSGPNGASAGYVRAFIGSARFEAVVTSFNGTSVTFTSGGDDIASMTVKGTGQLVFRWGHSSPLTYTLVASDNGSSPDTVTLTLSNGSSLSVQCMDCIEVTPGSSSA
jgi:hypothetical protein